MIFQDSLNRLNAFSVIFLISILTFTSWFFILGYNLLDQPFVWDDLHLIRKYSIKEIYSSWIDNWNPNLIETPSYRPFAIMFYHAIGQVFGENTFYLRIFIIFMMFILILLANILLYKVGLNRIELIIFTLLIVFSKIFTTLVAWMTLGALIFAYVIAFLSIIFFIIWLDKNKIKNYLFSFLFAFIAIFTREELYVLPGVFFLILMLTNSEIKKNFKKICFGIIPFGLLVIVHMYLRKEFVPEADSFEITLDSIKYGTKEIGFGGLFKAFKASWLPMGYNSFRGSNINEHFFQLVWLSLLIFTFIINYKFRKNISLNLKKIFIFVLLILLFCLPHITVVRSFGIFLSSTFVYALISIMLMNLIKLLFLNKNYLYKGLYLLTFFLILATGIYGGIIRSKEHLNSMNLNSVYIVNYDTNFIFHYHALYPNVNMPEKRYQKKLSHLKSLNISKEIDDLEYYRTLSNKIVFTKYDPLAF